MNKKLISAFALSAMLAAMPTTALAETVTIDFGNPVVSVDADDFIMQEVAGVNEQGVVLVPVRDVAEAFKGTVIYDAGQNTVKLTFPNGNWADIAISDIAKISDTTGTATVGDGKGQTGVGTFINDKLYIPVDLMAACLGARYELIDYGRDEIFRIIYHVRV